MANIKKKGFKKPQGNKKVSPPTLEAVLKAAKAIGATQIEYNGITVTWGDKEAKPNTADLKANIKQTASSTPATSSAKAEDLISPESVWDQYSEDEILMWSTVHYDEMQAKKDAQMKKEQEDGNQ